MYNSYYKYELLGGREKCQPIIYSLKNRTSPVFKKKNRTTFLFKSSVIIRALTDKRA